MKQTLSQRRALRRLRRKHEEACEKARIYPGYGWGKVVKRLNAAIMMAIAPAKKPSPVKFQFSRPTQQGAHE